MKTDNKRAYAQSGLEMDVLSKYARTVCAYLANNRGIIRFVKRKINKRMRQYNKQLTREIE
jgi:hypothetical protein